MLWQDYVFRRGSDVHGLWDRMFGARKSRILYIAGRGFDIRATTTMKAFAQNILANQKNIESAELLLVSFEGYELTEELKAQTEKNAAELESIFSQFGTTEQLSIKSSAHGEDDIKPATVLKMGIDGVLAKVKSHTDIVLDVSSLPRVAYLSLLTGLLQKIISNRKSATALSEAGINLQVLVAEDPVLDAQIKSEDPHNDLVMIPGYSTALYAESMKDWPTVWFPVLGEGRIGQLTKVMMEIPDNAEICPVLPHPSVDPRRADRLLLEYKVPLFDGRQTPTSNIIYAHEAHPFEVYRQLRDAMARYRKSLELMGGCRLFVTPLGSKLITLGVGLACFEMRTESFDENYGVAIPYAEPTRYTAAAESLLATNAEISALVLTGEAYAI